MLDFLNKYYFFKDKKGIFTAALIIVIFSVFLNIWTQYSMFRKILFNKNSKMHSSKYINYFTKLSFSLEMHAFGKVIDRVCFIHFIFLSI